MLNSASAAVARLPQSIRSLPEIAQVGLAIFLLFILAAIPLTSKFAVWIALALLLLVVINGGKK